MRTQSSLKPEAQEGRKTDLRRSPGDRFVGTWPVGPSRAPCWALRHCRFEPASSSRRTLSWRPKAQESDQLEDRECGHRMAPQTKEGLSSRLAQVGRRQKLTGC